MKEFNPSKLKIQLREAKEYATSKNLIFDETFSFQDLGVSGFHGENKKVGKLGLFLFAAKHGIIKKGSYLLIENLDRLSRESARHALRTLEAICDEGITVVTMGDRKEYTAETLDKDPTELLYSILIFIRGNEESQTKSRRIKAAWQRKIAAARRGEKTTLNGRCPCWLKIIGEEYVVIEEKAKVIKKMFEMAKVGMGCTAIASKLNSLLVPTFFETPHWQSSNVIYLLRKQSVTGRLITRTKTIVDGKTVFVPAPPILNFYPRIISERLWKIVQKEINGRRDSVKALRAGMSNKLQNIFGHITRCQDCGGIMRRKKRNILLTHQHKTQPYLICNTSEEFNKCRFNPVLYRPIHDAFLKKGVKMLEGHYAQLLKKEINQEPDQENLERILLEPKIQNVKNSIVTAEFSRPKLNNALRSLFFSVIVRIEEGILEFHWAYGGISELSYFKEYNRYLAKLIRGLEISPTNKG